MKYGYLIPIFRNSSFLWHIFWNQDRPLHIFCLTSFCVLRYTFSVRIIWLNSWNVFFVTKSPILWPMCRIYLLYFKTKMLSIGHSKTSRFLYKITLQLPVYFVVVQTKLKALEAIFNIFLRKQPHNMQRKFSPLTI